MLQTEIAPLNILNLNYFRSYQAYQTSTITGQLTGRMSRTCVPLWWAEVLSTFF